MCILCIAKAYILYIVNIKIFIYYKLNILASNYCNILYIDVMMWASSSMPRIIISPLHYDYQVISTSEKTI